MVENSKRPKIVGNFIRQRREALGLSQRALGLLFEPPVTTQFISNVERGVTPLPPAHVPTLAKALVVTDAEIMSLLEREYTMKLSGRLGRSDSAGAIMLDPPGSVASSLKTLAIEPPDYDFMRTLYDSFRQADPKSKQAFLTVCETIFKISRPH